MSDPVSDFQAASDWHRLGAGLSVRFSLDGGKFCAEWLPRRPTRREFKRLMARYREARGLFLVELAGRTGRDVVCLELGE